MILGSEYLQLFSSNIFKMFAGRDYGNIRIEFYARWNVVSFAPVDILYPRPFIYILCSLERIFLISPLDKM